MNIPHLRSPMRIIRAELHLVGIVKASTVGTLHHSKLFSKLFGIHDNVRLPNVIRKAASVIGLNDVLNRNISPCYAGCGSYPHDCTCTGFAVCPVGDMLALLEVAEWCRRPENILKLFIECTHFGSSLSARCDLVLHPDAYAHTLTLLSV